MIDRPITIPLGLLLISIAVLGSAYAFQHIGGLQPCTLCLYQRWPWWVAGGLSVLALTLIRERRFTRALSALGALSVLIGMGIAVYHAGVEQHWWAGPTACSGAAAPKTLEALRAQIFAAPVVRCDDIPWSLFGISMAGYNALISLATGLAILWLLRRNTRSA
ncbi:MAG: disulfide bond formation protein B [Alphaproteobacteria bacterium]|nr:disulfide bond formation protein B [Alphaproteobacteria bacterium]